MAVHCRWVGREIECSGPAVRVAITESNSGSGGTVIACQAHTDRLGILPIDEHPEDSLGTRVLYR